MMLKLYHGTTSVCSQKVRLVLEEKGLTWESEILDLVRGDQFDPDYVKLNPNAVVPTLVHDGKVLGESSIIIDYLDSLSQPRTLVPDDPYLAARTRLWGLQSLEFHASVNTLTFATVGRKGLLDQPPEKREERYARIPDLFRARKLKDLVENGVRSDHVLLALRRYGRMFDEMEKSLTETGWLVGKGYGLADATVTSYIYRLECLGLEGFWEGRRPLVQDWWKRIKARDNFRTAILDYMDPERVAGMRATGLSEVSQVPEYRPFIGA